MDDLARSRFRSCLLKKTNKKAPVPHMGQEQNSCDTTQIDAFAPTRCTHHHACPRLITGGNPVEAYRVYTLSVRPPKSIRLPAKDPLLTTGGSLCFEKCSVLLFVNGFGLLSYYMLGFFSMSRVFYILSGNHEFGLVQCPGFRAF